MAQACMRMCIPADSSSQTDPALGLHLTQPHAL